MLNVIYKKWGDECWASDSCSQEIRCGRPGGDDPFRVRHSSEELWLPCVGVFEDHDGGDVATAVAVVGGRPHGDQLLIKHELIAFVDELVGPADELQVVDVNKLEKNTQTHTCWSLMTFNTSLGHLWSI